MRHYTVTLADALEAHDTALAESGGRPGLRSESDLLSALGRPYSGYHRPIHRKAAALLQAIASNHAFIDGNKRTALILTNLLIEKSGYRLQPFGREHLNDALEDFVVHVVEDHLSLDAIAAWLKERIERKSI
ncbi:type II toxin-antitoxin system death-on-curing family toxin [Hyphomicrobium sp.]|uniref:type II toxin-antitoxin system death-on-curing family toxin n=1 Tax=Hyphomicrobium sp. TaxID=82 RepID=UPI001DAE168C|nr:type II toxin-antitoxin system death-on-curing family toxin [Hyphomicrobium sp.]MBY0559847.1 type II toxin-antitoxin system death-on-curing family toxin [Hyphomicrobium sp.]